MVKVSHAAGWLGPAVMSSEMQLHGMLADPAGSGAPSRRCATPRQQFARLGAPGGGAGESQTLLPLARIALCGSS